MMQFVAVFGTRRKPTQAENAEPTKFLDADHA